MEIFKRWQQPSMKLNDCLKTMQTIKRRNKYAVIFFVLSAFVYGSCYAGINTELYGDDNYAGPFPVGFTFNHYGNSFNEFYVSTNGLIQFTNPT